MAIKGANILIKGGTAAALAADNPVLAMRELCGETDSAKLKIGDGVRRYNDLPYIGGGGEIEALEITVSELKNELKRLQITKL